jgi:4-amino-4-deoxy-L-arabinose transferase-like glycosyltransferase
MSVTSADAGSADAALAASATATADSAADAASATVEPEPIVKIPSRPLVVVRVWEVTLVCVLACALYLPRLGAYNLWDPWETHYGEVARRMLADQDWIQTKWQNEPFRSKPVLTFWLMGLGMKAFGVGDGGGYSGEFVSNPWVEFSIRLPFALFGIAGLTILWYALARLYSRRAAWLATGILAACPYYFYVSRQAITDMPSCAMLVGSMALFALAIFDEDKPLRRWKFGLTWFHFFVGVLSLAVLPQLFYFVFHLSENKLRLAGGRSIPGPLMMLPFFGVYAGVIAWAWVTTKTRSQVYMYFFYLLSGMALLAKGPVAPALAGLTILVYLIVSGEWRLLLKCEIPRGLLIAIAVGVPWHIAMYLKDGQGWANEYFGQHIFNRAFKGVFGDRGTFNYYLSQLGVGMWPWGAFVPAALGAFAFSGRARTREERLRLMFGIWAVVAATFFMWIETKFHHYILPAVPALAVLVAFYLDDLLDKRIKWATAGLVLTLGVFLIISLDLVNGELRLTNLYIFRYDRPWPSAEPWKIDFTNQLTWFALAMGAALVAILFPRVRQWAAGASVLVSLAFAIFVIQVLMIAASPHWGQKELHQNYYAHRQIFGVDLEYTGLRELREDWTQPRDFEVRSVVPETLHEGDPQKITIAAGGEKVVLDGTVSKIDRGDDRFSIHIADAERAKLSALLERAKTAKEGARPRWLSVNADRLLAWQLNWRGENFYSGGEIYQHHFEDGRTVYMDVDNKKFLEYLNAPARNGRGRKFWVITEKGRLSGLPNVLPTPYGKQTFKVEDNSSNKFGLGSFTMDEAAPAGAPPPAELK